MHAVLERCSLYDGRRDDIVRRRLLTDPGAVHGAIAQYVGTMAHPRT